MRAILNAIAAFINLLAALGKQIQQREAQRSRDVIAANPKREWLRRFGKPNASEANSYNDSVDR